MTEDRALSRPLSRRSMLKTGAVASAGIWAAPSILSLDRAAAAVGSCGTAPRQVDFSRFSGNLPSSFTSDDGAVNITFTQTDNDGVQDPSYDGIIFNGLMNGLDNPVVNGMSGATGGDQVRWRFDFSEGVCPSFYLVDVDRAEGGSNEFEDTIVVFGRLNGGPRVDPASFQLGGSQVQVNSRTVRGISSTSTTSGNVLVTFDQPIDRLIIRHRDVSTLSGFQWIGVHDFHWC
ncbi:MAG: hypothetical protein AAF548_05240 [Actinomycetota bacterium]